MPRIYIQFAEIFEQLSPYELSHFAEVLLCKVEDCFEGKLFSASQKELTDCDLKISLVNAMRDVLLEMKELEISQLQIKLDEKKAQVFSIKKVKVAA